VWVELNENHIFEVARPNNWSVRFTLKGTSAATITPTTTFYGIDPSNKDGVPVNKDPGAPQIEVDGSRMWSFGWIGPRNDNTQVRIRFYNSSGSKVNIPVKTTSGYVSTTSGNIRVNNNSFAIQESDR
jgi:hypothetical protein